MLFTSESVSCGHPDKICDHISDAILDEFLRQDAESKVACECFITNNMLVIGGEAHSSASVDIIGIAKKVLEKIGYNGTNGFNPETAVFVNTLHEQSSDIRQGVNREDEKLQGAGDQGIMFGYAIANEYNYMPLPIFLSNETMKAYDLLRNSGMLPGANPDAKCQYTVKFEEGKKPTIETIVFSMQHKESINEKTLKNYFHKVIIFVIKANPQIENILSLSDIYNGKIKVLINPTGKFVIGGPEGDTGLTGRKIIVDTYGGSCPHGGGCFSGKDPSKVDRSAAYYARYIAKNLVAADIADELIIQLSYAIGVAEPVSINVTGKNLRYTEDFIVKMIYELFNPTPYNIANRLNLKRPIYEQTSTYGHFGNNDYPWERLDMVDDIHKYIELTEK